MKTYCEFTFEAAHSVAPYSGLHGHTFIVKLTFGGAVEHGSGLDHGNLDLNPEIGIASLENVTTYIWRLVKARFPNLEEVELKRGMSGSSEGCIYRGEAAISSSLAA
jgi:6-pyruvoyltetrahydropterin/6-carboxytetrahydropterin synthase